MITRNKILVGVAAAAVLVTGLHIAPTTVFAQEEESERRQTRQVQAASRKVYDKLTEAQELMEAGDAAGAFSIMRNMESDDDLSSYERVLVYQMLGYLHANADEYPQALNYFEKMIAEEDCPPGLRNQTLYTIGQLYMATEQYAKAVEKLNEWFATAESAAPSAYMLLASAYAQMEDYEAAKEPAETGLALGKEIYANMTEARKTDPEAPEPEPVQENWYTLTLATAMETRDYDRARELINELLQKFPKKDYWLYLSGISSELGNEMDQLGAMEAAWRQDLLTRGTELQNLAQLYMYHQIPIKGAWRMEEVVAKDNFEDEEEEAKAWELLANAYYNANEMEKSIEPLTKAAALSDDGQLYIRLGQSYMDLAQWDNAADAFGKAIRKGGLDRPGEAPLMQGMSYFNGGDFDDARSAFREARGFDDTRQSAIQWLGYLEAEERRRQLR